MKRYDVTRGDSTLNLKVTVENYPSLDENWICTQALFESITDEVAPVFFREVDKRDDLSAFDVHLSPTDTIDSNLIEGKTYYWQIVVTNPTMTPAYSKTITNKLEIKYRG